jgi:hypothetical protein
VGRQDDAIIGDPNLHVRCWRRRLGVAGFGHASLKRVELSEERIAASVSCLLDDRKSTGRFDIGLNRFLELDLGRDHVALSRKRWSRPSHRRSHSLDRDPKISGIVPDCRRARAQHSDSEDDPTVKFNAAF